MWYPTKLQWSIIWATTLLCTVLWLAKDPGPKSFILPGLLVAGLFVWQASADFRGTKG